MPPLVFYLDENFPEVMAALLIALGFEAVSTNSLGRKGARDHNQLLFAAQTERVVVTYNVADFLLLHDAWRDWSAAWGTSPTVARHAGILIFHQDKRGFPVATIAQLIADLVGRSGSLENRCFVWKRVTGWREV